MALDSDDLIILSCFCFCFLFSFALSFEFLISWILSLNIGHILALLIQK